MTVPLPLFPITLEDHEHRRYAFMPQSDMTGLESALLTQLFIKMTLNRSGTMLDWMAYLHDHRLERHFSEPLLPLGASLNDAEPITQVIELTEAIEGLPVGSRLTISDDMPVPDGYRLVTAQELEAELAGAGGIK